MGVFADRLKRIHGKAWFALAMVLLLSVVTIVVPIGFGGIRRSVDLHSHLSFAQAFREAISAGDLYPGWANDNLGFGSVGVRFYPPVAAFVVALIALVTNDWYAAYALSIFGWMALGCFGVYLFVSEWGTPAQALFAAALYSIAPFHLAEVYKFFLFAEFAAAAVLPFCVLYLTRVCRRRDWTDVIPLTVSFSILVLTHLPLSIISIISMLIFVPIASERSHRLKIVKQLAAGALLTILATSFYWITVLSELQWVAHSDPKYSITAYEPGAFLFPNSLGSSLPSIFDPLMRHVDLMTVLTLGFLVPFVVLLIADWRRAPSNRVAVALSVTALFGVVMMSKPSGFLWANLTLLQRLQYPWRWLSIVSILAAASCALSLSLLSEVSRSYRRISLVVMTGLVVLIVAYDARQVSSPDFKIFRSEFNELADDIRRQPTAVHWWPVWAAEASVEQREPVTVSGRNVRISVWDTQRRELVVDSGRSGSVQVATFYYPHWSASVNGLPVEVEKDSNGIIVLPIGEERSDILLRFEEPPQIEAATCLSGATWIVLLVGWLAWRFRRRMIRTTGSNKPAR